MSQQKVRSIKQKLKEEKSFDKNITKMATYIHIMTKITNTRKNMKSTNRTQCNAMEHWRRVLQQMILSYDPSNGSHWAYGGKMSEMGRSELKVEHIGPKKSERIVFFSRSPNWGGPEHVLQKQLLQSTPQPTLVTPALKFEFQKSSLLKDSRKI